LDQYLETLKPTRHIAMITFHSLEDRIVKQKFRATVKNKQYQFVIKKPLRPTQDEKKRNSRSHSARLRVIERI